MHTVEELNRADFEYRMNGQEVPRSDVMPSIGIHDRVGVVMPAGIDGLGAGNFLLSCVTEFYVRLGEERDDFFEYPDYYTFQTTDAIDYGMLDVYPAHKNVTVEANAERLLRSINDRGINIILVPDVSARTPELEALTRRSAERRIDYCYLYAPDGRPRHADFAIRLPRYPTARWYSEAARSVDPQVEADIDLSVGSQADRIIQQYKRVPFDRALSRLPTEEYG